MTIYLDNSATTPLDSKVLEAMLPYLRDVYGNASSIHSFGQKARIAVEESREKVALLIGAHPKEIIFTSGGTESDNFALRGILAMALPDRTHILTCTIEHPAVLTTCQRLQQEGIPVTYLPVDQDGVLHGHTVLESVTENTLLVSVMHANNETGTTQAIPALAGMAHERGALFHTDAVQSAGKIPVNVGEMNVALLSLSAHKIHGPKGIGALYARSDLEMKSLFFGGHQERSRRPGTENVAAIVGFGIAAELAQTRLQDQVEVTKLRDHLVDGLTRRVKGVRINGSTVARLPNIANLSFEGIEGEGMTIALDLEGIAVSTGSACSSGSLEPSHVLLALGHKKEEVQGSIRFSLSRMNTLDEINYCLGVIPQIVERLRSYAPVSS